MASLISVNAEIMLPDQTWEKGQLTLFPDRMLFDGKSKYVEETCNWGNVTYKRETYQRKKFFVTRGVVGISLCIDNDRKYSFCLEEVSTVDRIIHVIESEQSHQKRQTPERYNHIADEASTTKAESEPEYAKAEPKHTSTADEVYQPQKDTMPEISQDLAEAEKQDSPKAEKPVRRVIYASDGKCYDVSSEPTEYAVIRINKVNSLGRIISTDDIGYIKIKLENGTVYKVNLELYLDKKLMFYVKKPEDKEIELANTVKQSDTPTIKEEKKAGKKKVNLKNATRDLVTESQALLDIAANARREADKLYDELEKLSQSSSESDIDQKIQSTSDNEQLQNDESLSEKNEEGNTEKPSLSFTPDVGSVVQYGEYKHIPLRWIIIGKDDKGYLLLSIDVVAQREFHKSFAVWSNCDLKKWLNSTFIKKAFSEEETSSLYIGNYVSIGTASNQAPSAQVFVLNDQEFNALVPQNYQTGFARRSNGEPFAVKWWLRTSGDTTKNACYVDEKGNIGSGPVNNDKIGVRPAMWLEASRLIGTGVVTLLESTPANKQNSTADVIVPGAEKKQGETNEPKTGQLDYEQNDTSDSHNVTISTPHKDIKQIRAIFVDQCTDFSNYCAGLFPEKRITFENSDKTDKPLPFLFDLTNCRYSHMEGKYSGIELPMYFHASNGTLVKCRCDGIYNNELLSSYMLFLGASFKDQERILSCAIQDSIGSQRTSNVGIDMMCLMPDALDDFNQLFRSQLNGLFQVPRSIALAYSLLINDQKLGRKTPKEFIVVDYDCEEFSAVKIVKAQDERGRPYFIRWGRISIPDEHLSYRSMASEYIKRYKKKNGISLTAKMEAELIDTKLVQQLLLDPERRPVLLVDGDAWVNVWPDYDIVDELHTMLAKDIDAICNSVDIPVCSICSFGWSNQRLIFGIDSLETGCIELCRRYNNNQTLWEEYLPKLELGIHLDGTFSDLLLIGEKERHQKISSAYLGKTISFHVNDGVITLDKGLDHYDLPLVREVYGSLNKEKMARFTPKEPFTEDETVRLQIDYRYGDVDSYKLIATFDDGREPLISEWCDAEELPNVAPVYTSQDLEPMFASGNSAVVSWFKNFVKNVNATTMPWGGDSLYDPPKNPYKLDRKPYSRYLEDINGPYGFPFKQVRWFFDRGNQSKGVKEQINKMFKDGVFSCIADVLEGKLPRNHNLSKGSSKTYPNYDQQECLITNLRRVCAALGILYTYNSKDIAAIIKGIYDYDVLEVWAPVTTYVTRENDPYGVWDKFSECLYMMSPQNNPISELRAISNVCFLTQEWIFELYHGPNGKRDISHLIECIKSVVFSNEWKEGRALPYNAKRIRDVLELLLCITLLKKEDPTILDSNAQETKAIVRQLKFIDNEMRRLREEGNIEKGRDFNSRIGGIEGHDYQRKYQRVNKVIYALIVTLTGGETINLVGFKGD